MAGPEWEKRKMVQQVLSCGSFPRQLSCWKGFEFRCSSVGKEPFFRNMSTLIAEPITEVDDGSLADLEAATEAWPNDGLALAAWQGPLLGLVGCVSQL